MQVLIAKTHSVSTARRFNMMVMSQSSELGVKHVASISTNGLWNPITGWLMHDLTLQLMQTLEMCIITHPIKQI